MCYYVLFAKRTKIGEGSASTPFSEVNCVPQLTSSIRKEKGVKEIVRKIV